MGAPRRPRPVPRSGRDPAPTRAGRAARRRGRAGGPHGAGRGLDRVVRGTGVRGALGHAAAAAARKCPDAVFLPVDGPTYEAASARVMESLRAHEGAVVQVLGWDEAFVGLTTPGDDVAEAVAHADAIRAEVLEASRLHCSVGVGDTTVRAKIATDLGKPQGTFVLTRDNWFEVMGERPTTALWGVGSRIAARLATHGYDTVQQLADASDEVLTHEFGPRMGPHYGRLGRGLGATVIDDTPWVARAHGREMTFQADLTEPDDVVAAVRALAEQVVEDIRREDRACARVSLKVRFAPFFTTTRIRTLAEPTFDPGVIAGTALELLSALDDDRPVRLLGVRAEMVPPEGGYEPPRTTGRGGPAALPGGDLPSG